MSKSKRIFIISSQINQKSVSEIIESIFEINHEDDHKREQYKNYKREPVKLLLNTYGGSVYDGLGLIGAIEQSTTPVHITCLGSAMSMGLFILVSGHKRFIHKYSTVMYHQISNFVYDKLEGIKLDLEESQRLEKVCEEILLRHTFITKEQLDDFKERKAEWFIPADEAFKLGIVDKIL